MKDPAPSTVTGTALENVPGTAPLGRAVDRAREYADKGVPDSTRALYERWLTRWATWADAHQTDVVPASPLAVAGFLAELADQGVRPATIGIVRAAIAFLHRVHDVPSPTNHEAVRLALRGIRRVHGTGSRRVEPAIVSLLSRMLPRGDRLIEVRDRAILLVGFAAALRRSELAGLTVERVRFVAEGLDLDLGKTKTDQEAANSIVSITPAERDRTMCPVAALRAWLDVSGITEGAVFRAVTRHGQIREPLPPRSIAAAVKRGAVRAGLDPRRYAGHSLRAGFVTEALLRDRPEVLICQQTRHSTKSGVVRDYARFATRYEKNAGRGLL